VDFLHAIIICVYKGMVFLLTWQYNKENGINLRLNPESKLEYQMKVCNSLAKDISGWTEEQSTTVRHYIIHILAWMEISLSCRDICLCALPLSLSENQYLLTFPLG
jgi:hypothetical protein